MLLSAFTTLKQKKHQKVILNVIFNELRDMDIMGYDTKSDFYWHERINEKKASEHLRVSLLITQ